MLKCKGDVEMDSYGEIQSNNFNLGLIRTRGNLKVSPNIYHNTKLLLKLYNKVLWRINNSFEEIEADSISFSGKKLDELIENLTDTEEFISEAKLESRLQSIADSKSIINLIEKALMMLKSYPENGERYYSIIYKIYISAYPYCENEILEYLCCSRATYYREKRNAINLLGTILWGYLFPNFIKELKSLELIQD